MSKSCVAEGYSLPSFQQTLKIMKLPPPTLCGLNRRYSNIINAGITKQYKLARDGASPVSEILQYNNKYIDKTLSLYMCVSFSLFKPPTKIWRVYTQYTAIGHLPRKCMARVVCSLFLKRGSTHYIVSGQRRYTRSPLRAPLREDRDSWTKFRGPTKILYQRKFLARRIIIRYYFFPWRKNVLILYS